MDNFSEAEVRRCSVKKVLLKILQNNKTKIPVLEYLFNKGMRPVTLLKKDSSTSVFVEFCEIYKNTYFVEIREGLLLFAEILTQTFVCRLCRTFDLMEMHIIAKRNDSVIFNILRNTNAVKLPMKFRSILFDLDLV